MKSTPFGAFFLMVNQRKKKRQMAGVSEEEFIKSQTKPFV